MASKTILAESVRLEKDESRQENWKRWGPYLSERQWGTVREDYSGDGDAWAHFPFEQAHLRAYRWGEDGLLGMCDRQGRLCFSVALWNEKDPILKERLFGLSGPEGNHAEDCKELYYYQDSTPTHSYFKALYKYPQAAFPYDRLRRENGNRGKSQDEYEILDTGVFDQSRYFDLTAEYAKESPNSLLIKISIANRGDTAARLHALPQIWFRNTWIWGCEHEGCTLKPCIEQDGERSLSLRHESLGEFRFAALDHDPQFLFTDNETNTAALYGTDNYTKYVKDAFGRFLIDGDRAAVDPSGRGTKAAAYSLLEVEAGETVSLCFRLYAESERPRSLKMPAFERVLGKRIQEADEFWSLLNADPQASQAGNVRRQAFAGLLWSKQFYHYSVHDWLKGDSAVGASPESRESGRNAGWGHLFNRDVISMPDKWEYPWFAAWDLAFHMVPFAEFDPAFAKQQLILFLREWYMHPNGQIPAYEWEFGDVNPPVHAWACWRVYQIEKKEGTGDIDFLKRVFQKLLLNFTWWVNRKDPEGNNIFAGGFLGLDNIGLFDRSKPLPGGGKLQQADGTAWMAFYCSSMLAIALELAKRDNSYSDVASKFFEHFVGIADAMNTLGGDGLWDEEDGFYYDELRTFGCEHETLQLKIRSMVGLIPLFAVEILEESSINELPNFKKRMNWYLEHRKDLAKRISCMSSSQAGAMYLLAIPSRERLERLLLYLLDESEFLSPFGIRSLSKFHEDTPYRLSLHGEDYEVRYTPGESDSYLFGGNSNWRGPIWFPVNFLIIESIERYARFYGDSFKIELPTGSGSYATLNEVADFLRNRLSQLFLPDPSGQRPAHGDDQAYITDPNFKKNVLFYEYFHGDTGKGLGASHQTGWTALVASMLG